MKYAHRLSVRAATAIVIVCVLATTGVIVVATRASAARHDTAQQEAARAIINSAHYEDALGSTYDEWVTIIDYFVLQDPSYVDRFNASRTMATNALVALRDDALVHDPEDAVRLNDMIATHARFADGDEQVIAAIRSGDVTKAISIAVGSGVTADSDQLLAALRQRIVDQRLTLNKAQDDQQAAEASTLRWSLGIGAMCAGLLLVMGLAALEWIGRPLRRASEATRAIAAGDLTATVQREGPAELANLANDVNSMAASLIRRSEELNSYLSKNLETRTAELERTNAELARQVEERTRAEEALARTLEIERELEEQLRHQAFHDPLTNLANRARFMDRLEHGLQRATRRAEGMAILFIDLDDFKSVNDSLGHPAGDQLLIEVAARLETCLRPGDTAARLGGDEFAILLEALGDPGHAIAVADRIIASLRVPAILSGTEVFVSGSVGIAISTAGSTGEELLRRADVAMYAAKSDGKSKYTVYATAMEQSLVGHLQLAGELQRALERNELVVYYQPSVILSSQKIAGLEALVRWQHPTRGLVLPNDFVPIAEENGLILPIGRWVLREACRQMRAWQLEYPSDPPLSVAVNVSARQIHQPGFVQVVFEALRDSDLPAESLVLEITETLVMQNAELAITRLHELKALGVRLAIDDFGTGYSSLSYLRRFPVDILKIDKSFVDGVGETGKERELAQSIIDLGQTLNLEIVAEGVERSDQLGWLRSRNCDLAQGFLFSQALDADTIGTLLNETAGGAMTQTEQSA
jgi:diguanylate cyclase (GGDEF)-like protein